MVVVRYFVLYIFLHQLCRSKYIFFYLMWPNSISFSSGFSKIQFYPVQVFKHSERNYKIQLSQSLDWVKFNRLTVLLENWQESIYIKSGFTRGILYGLHSVIQWLWEVKLRGWKEPAWDVRFLCESRIVKSTTLPMPHPWCTLRSRDTITVWRS